MRRARDRIRPLQPTRERFLNGTIDATTSFADNDIRTTIQRFSAEARQANHALVDLIANMADRKGATPGQIALAWLLAQTPWIVPIPCTRRLERLDENIGAVARDLTPDDLSDLERATSQVKV